MAFHSLSRRQLLKDAAATSLSLTAIHSNSSFAAVDQKFEFPSTRRITTGPRHHWFGYYDKLQFDPTVRYVLGMEVDFEHRSPTADVNF